MARGLSVSDIVSVNVYISPIAAGLRNFGVALVLGDADAIDTAERIREYATLDEVGDDFLTTDPEFLAAELYFSQQPRPNVVYVGRWARTNTHAVLHGGVLDPANLDMGVWAAITAGSMVISVNGTPQTLTALDFSGETNLNGVADVITAALTGATVTYDAVRERFDIKTTTTGTTATLGYATNAGSGTAIAAMLGLTSPLASTPVNGVLAETFIEALLACANANADWYGVVAAASVMPSDNDLINGAAYIEGSARPRMIGITTNAPHAVDATSALDIGSRLKALGYSRSYVHYSRYSPYAAVSAFGRAFTTDFDATDTMYTLKFKQMPGVVAEYLTETESRVLRSKNINVFDHFDNDTSIIQEGVMANGWFFDERHGFDWLSARIQNDLWNVLYQSQTKIPQTDPGMTVLIGAATGSCEAAVNNGLLAPGVWNGPPIGGRGGLKTGTALNSGYFIYMPPVASQPPADREKRRAPTMQIAAKAAGAVHFVDVIVNVNR